MTQEEDLEQFAALSASVAADASAESDDDWEGSPFLWIKQISAPRKKGKVGEELVKAWAREVGLTVTRPTSSDHDTVIDGCLVEVKLSLVWASGQFVFQQIRDQNYEVAALLGLEPLRPYLWFVPKDILRENSTSQHGGQDGEDTRWLRFPASSPPAWLNDWGGSPSVGTKALEKARRGLGG